MTQELLRLDEAMQVLGLKSYQTLNRFIEAGLPVVEVNGTKRIKKESIMKFLQEHEKSTVASQPCASQLQEVVIMIVL